MSSNQASTAAEDTSGAAGGNQKKVITADKVRSALMEREDMMLNEGGTAGAAQYEEAYGGSNNRSNQMYGVAGGALQPQPRKLGVNNRLADAGGNIHYLHQNNNNDVNGNDGSQRESLPPMNLPSGAIYTG
jgi:hypothetical protein